MSSKTPSVSVLVPVYNVEKYLEQCLDSLVAQTLKNIEIICVNDGSTDSSLKILERYAKSDQRIVIVSKQNGGLPSARNAGLDAATGEYVGFVDGDDYVDADMFRRLYEEARKKDADMVVCGAKCFPNEDHAPAWMKEALSPDETFFKNATLELFFTQKGARPFIWRDLVKRSLIESNRLRLDPSIVLGEDTAFQYKLYSYAKRVSFLPDKLYYYRYARPGSIMENMNYRDEPSRVIKHIHMLKSVWQNRNKDLRFSQEKDFFEWAVDFIYWDLVRISEYARIEIGKKFCEEIVPLGFYKYYSVLSDRIKAEFDFIHTAKDLKTEKPKVTFVLVMNGCADYLNRCLYSLFSQTYKNFELLIYENGADEKSLHAMWDAFYKDSRIALRLSQWQPLCYHYNDALSIASGDYIVFLNGFDYYKDFDWVKKAVEVLDAQPETDLVCGDDHFFGAGNVTLCQAKNYRLPMYRIEKIRKNKIGFEDYSFLTGSVFMTKYCLQSKTVFNLPMYLQQGNHFHRASIYAEEAKLLLRAMTRLLKIARENNLGKLGRRITEMLNTENYVRLITDSTYGFNVSKASLCNPKEDFHKEVFELLAEANRLAFLEKDELAVLETLSVFIMERHLFLERF